jgi:adenylate cyclase
MAVACCMTSQHAKALGPEQRAVQEQLRWTGGYHPLASSLAHLGRIKEARAVMARLLENDLAFSLDFRPRVYVPSAGRDIFMAGLRIAGAPE